MAPPLANITQRAFHSNAAARAQELVRIYSINLLMQSRVLAAQEDADVVLSTHVDTARDVLAARSRQSWSRSLLTILGGALFGAFAQGFVTELSANRPALVAVYTIFGMCGLMMVFLGIRK